MSKVANKSNEESQVAPGEVRVQSQCPPKPYVVYAKKLLLEDNFDTIMIKGVGQSIPTVVIVSEILKREVPGLHQQVVTGSLTAISNDKTVKEGAYPKMASIITITLSRNKLNTRDPGYQAPLTDEEVKEFDVATLYSNRSRPTSYRISRNRRGRRVKGDESGSNKEDSDTDDNAGDSDGQKEKRRFRGRPSGRGGFRGRRRPEKV